MLDMTHDDGDGTQCCLDVEGKETLHVPDYVFCKVKKKIPFFESEMQSAH